MALVSAKEMLQKAKAGHYAVGQFNINNLEWTKAILLTAEECKSPVILGVSEGAGKYMAGYKTVVGMVNGMLEELNITVPVALHLDHGSYEGAKKCIEAGFSSIMFDGSHLPFEENVEKTKELVAICNEKGMSLEAEVGSIGGEEDGVVGMGECADPQECKAIADLGVTMLAAGIGNIHGKIIAGIHFPYRLFIQIQLLCHNLQDLILIILHKCGNTLLGFHETVNHIPVFFIKILPDSHGNNGFYESFSVSHHMISLLLGLISGCTCNEGRVHAAAVQGCLCVRNGHIHIIHIINGQATPCKIGCQKLMKICPCRASNGLSLKTLRCGQAVISGIQ